MHVDTDSQKLKVDQNLFTWTFSKMGVASLVTGPYKIDCISKMNVGANSGKLKVDSMIFRLVFSKMAMIFSALQIMVSDP